MIARMQDVPQIPGGWTERTFPLAGKDFQLICPADPESYLTVQAEHPDDDCTDAAYWSYLWPASLRMAQCLTKVPWKRGSRVLELGCGIGCVGLACAAAGDRVTFSDASELAVQMAIYNAERNGISTTGLVFDWNEPPDQRYPVMVAAEVLYSEANHLPLLKTIAAMLDPGGCCWIGDPYRSPADAFSELAEVVGMKVTLHEYPGERSHVDADAGLRIFELRHH